MEPNMEVVLTPDEAQRLNNEGWALRLVNAVQRPSSEPRKYFVIGHRNGWKKRKRHEK